MCINRYRLFQAAAERPGSEAQQNGWLTYTQLTVEEPHLNGPGLHHYHCREESSPTGLRAARDSALIRNSNTLGTGPTRRRQERRREEGVTERRSRAQPIEERGGAEPVEERGGAEPVEERGGAEPSP